MDPNTTPPTPLLLDVCESWDKTKLESALSVVEVLSTEMGGFGVEVKEKQALKRRYGWKEPRFLTCYSKDGQYRDLGAYFDNAAKDQPVNVVANETLKFYGLDGAQHGSRDYVIRGKVVILRCEPPNSPITSYFGGVTETVQSSSNFPYYPVIPKREMVETLLFFKGKNLPKIAQQRDMARTFGLSQQHMSPEFLQQMESLNMQPAYSDMKSLYSPKQVQKSLEACTYCNKSRALAGRLKRCLGCKSVAYCGKECQKADWKLHKLECIGFKSKMK